MAGQTGPRPDQSMDNWLAMTGVLEIANAALFPYVTWLFGGRSPGLAGPFAWLGVATVSIVLVEGGAYWLLKRGGWFERTPAPARVRLLRGAYAATVALLCVFPVACVVALLAGYRFGVGDLLFGLFWYLCGAGEFVQYFLAKINMRGRELRRVVRTGKPVPARLRRELRRARGQIAHPRRAA